MSTNPFHYAMSLMESLYGITLPEDDFEETGLVAWGLIGNKRTRTYRYSTCMDACGSNGENSIQLPCNADIIDAVTTGWEDWGNTTNRTPDGDSYSGFVEQYIEARKGFQDPLYLSGKFIKYERVGDTLYFDRPYRKVNILYRGVILDEDGLPELTDKEALAIATYCAWVSKYKEGLLTNNPNIIQIADTLKRLWNVLVDQARTPEYLSQNELDQILDAKTSWNRKVHSKSYKYNR